VEAVDAGAVAVEPAAHGRGQMVGQPVLMALLVGHQDQDVGPVGGGGLGQRAGAQRRGAGSGGEAPGAAQEVAAVAALLARHGGHALLARDGRPALVARAHARTPLIAPVSTLTVNARSPTTASPRGPGATARWRRWPRRSMVRISAALPSAIRRVPWRV